ncbi:MAG: MBOAT family protein [Planctomycetes bacterium]|nr:MBOAT family protein [Planctomycetota bacterium]
MLFNSFSYILFLWTVYVLFWTWRERRSLRHTMVLLASYWFYGQADWTYTSLLALSTVIDYFSGLGIQRAREAGHESVAKRWMGVSLTMNLGLLGVFKYFDFFVGSFEQAFSHLGVDVSLWHLDVVLPVGISFYTFQTLSYTIDIYKGRMQPTRNFLDFALFVSFFPQLVAGPIVRAVDFVPQLENPPRFDARQLSSGLFQILRGLVKKLLMADVLGAHVVDLAFHDASSLDQLGSARLLLATYAYALQLYGDFAGYSDIAIGSARVLGFELRKNFDAPFKSVSLEDFWSRWHISMSSWFTDYVYIGLGGSRIGLWKACRNAFVAWTLVGLWHGAAWTFVLWGMYHGALLVVVRIARQLIPGGKLPDSWPVKLVSGLVTFHVVAYSMVLFRCADMTSFWTATRELFDWTGGSLADAWVALPWQIRTIMILGYATHLMPDRWQARLEGAWDRVPALGQGAVLAASIVLLFALRPPGLSPFVYFQF